MQTYFDSSLLAKNIDSAGHNQTVEDTANETNNDGESVHQPWREILVRSRRKSFQAVGYKLYHITLWIWVPKDMGSLLLAITGIKNPAAPTNEDKI